jgi:penicillin-binding protein 2
MDARNGDVLALASSPSMNPNCWAGNNWPPGEYARVNDLHLKPQLNRATQDDNFQPGSVFKIVVAMALLENGLNPEASHTVLPDPDNRARGIIYYGRNNSQSTRDTVAPGSYNFRRAFIKSSNSYFIHHGIEAGMIQKIIELGQRLHFGERCGIPTYQESKGNFPSLQRIRSSWSPGDTANLCIGQGLINVTPLQVAVMVSSVANGGRVFWPRVVQRLDSQDPLSAEPGKQFEAGRIRDNLGVSARTMQLVRAAMIADVEDPEGSGRKSFLDGFRIGGKTGTAQIGYRNDITGKITWFASFGGPSVEATPRYVVVVMVQGGISGGETCAPLAKEVYQAIRDMNHPQSIAMTNPK